MKCPHCGNSRSRVVDSREVEGGIRRRRLCLGCNKRFTTLEKPAPHKLFVVKRDRRREEFNREKLLQGLHRACEKRPLPVGAIDKVASDIESALYQMGKREVLSSVIGDMVMERLKTLDNIAYIRFASVYLRFSDITDLKQEVDTLLQSKPPQLVSTASSSSLLNPPSQDEEC